MIKGVICDLDGFLVETWGEKPLPGVVETLAELQRRGISLAVATNQAGPLWRAATGQIKYPTVEEVAARLLACAEALSLQNAHWFIAYYDERAMNLLSSEEQQLEALRPLWYKFDHLLVEKAGMFVSISARPDWRKPEPGMLAAACAYWEIDPAEAIYGGDMDTDRQAAEAAPMRFVEKLSDVLALLGGEQA